MISDLHFRHTSHPPCHLGLPGATRALCGHAPDWGGELEGVVLDWPHWCGTCIRVARRLDHQYGDTDRQEMGT